MTILFPSLQAERIRSAVVDYLSTTFALTDAEPRRALASSQAAPIQAWRISKLLAFQHHPESTPERISYWRARNALRHMGVPGADGVEKEDLPPEAIDVGEQARRAAIEIEPVVQAFGRSLARVFAREARAYSAGRKA